MKIGKTVNRPPTPEEVKSAKRAFCVFRAAMTIEDGSKVEGWFWAPGASWAPGQLCAGPFKTERQALEHAETYEGGMVQ
jgi:hypothetical protein